MSTADPAELLRQLVIQSSLWHLADLHYAAKRIPADQWAARLHAWSDANEAARAYLASLDGVDHRTGETLDCEIKAIVAARLPRITPAVPSGTRAAEERERARRRGLMFDEHDWTVGEQELAVAHGWALFLAGDGALVLEADTDQDVFTGADCHNQAWQHVEEVIRTNGKGLPYEYLCACRRAVEIHQRTCAAAAAEEAGEE